MRLSIVSAALVIAAECVYATGEIPPNEQPNKKGRPVSYSVELFPGPNCKGKKKKWTHKKFNCTLECHPSPGFLSARLKTHAYDELPWHYKPDDKAFGGSNPVVNYDYIATEGPMVMSYNDGECTRDQFHGRAHIERGDFESCVTFPSLAFGFQVVLLKMCGYDEQKEMILAARTRHGDLVEEDWFSPDRDKLELVLNWQSYEGKTITDRVDKPKDN